MKKQILITIGREYGSGGHDLAALLSQRLGIRMLDRELIDELWKNDPEMQQLAQQYDERPANRSSAARSMNLTTPFHTMWPSASST